MATSPRAAQSDESSIPLQDISMVRYHILDDQQQQQQQHHQEEEELLPHSVIQIHAHTSKARRTNTGGDGLEAGELLSWLWSGSKYSGALCIALSAISYTFMFVLVRLFKARTLPTFQVVFLRSALVAGMSCGMLKWFRTPLLGTGTTNGSCAARAAVGFVAMSGFLYSFQTLPAPDALLLSSFSPALATLLARLFLKERCEPKEVAGILCCTLGLSLVFPPTTILKGFFEYCLKSLVAFTAACLGAISYCLARYIVKAGESPLVLVFTFSIYCCPAAALCMVVFQSFLLPTFMEFLGMVCVGVFSFLGQVLLARALQLEKVCRATLVEYIHAVGVFVSAAMLHGQTPSTLSLFGASLAVVSVGFSICLD